MSTRGSVLLASPLAALLCSSAAFAQDRTVAWVRIYENPAVTATLLGRSLPEVEAILSRVGIEVMWRHCAYRGTSNPECAASPLPNEAVVRILPGRPTLSEHGCGITLVPDSSPAHFISLFADCIHAGAEEFRVPEAVVLAYCLAHEIGHVFMGASHGPAGLMQARPRPIDWQRAAAGGLGFTAAEGRRLRAAVARSANGFARRAE